MNLQKSYKCILLGDVRVGKTTLLESLYPPTGVPPGSTIGIDFRMIDLDKFRRIVLWDTSGMKRYRCITRSYYHDNDLVIFVFNVSNRSTFLNLSSWIDEYRLVSPLSKGWLFGNIQGGREVEEDEANAFAQSQGLTYIEENGQEATNIWTSIQQYVCSFPLWEPKEVKSKEEKKKKSCFSSWIIRI